MLQATHLGNKLQEASWRLLLPRGFKRLPEASQRLPEASRGFQKLPRGILLQIHCVLQSLFDGRFKSIVFYRRGRRGGGTRQSGPSHSGEAPRGQSDAQARRIRSIGFLEASRGFKEASMKLQEASWRLQEASKRHPRGIQKASRGFEEATRGFQEASRGLKRPQEASRGLQEQI